MQPSRAKLKSAKRIIIKVGTQVLVDNTGKPDRAVLRSIVKQCCKLKGDGKEIVLVTSGAIGAGMEELGLLSRPRELPELQMAAAVGQARLMQIYSLLFKSQGVSVGQILLTHDDLRHRERHLNARNTFEALIRNGIIPIVNENDVVSVNEIKIGDNDLLASLVTILTGADALILLTSAEGLLAPGKDNKLERISEIKTIDKSTFALAKGKTSLLSTGGMETKLLAAKRAADVGAAVIIAPGRKPLVLIKVVDGEDIGTYIHPHTNENGRSHSRKKWLTFFQRPQGDITIDRGASIALVEKGKSLLPVGVLKVSGRFGFGGCVNVRDHKGGIIAQGIVNYSSADLAQICGKRSSEIEKLLGSKPYEEVIHRDNLVLVSKG